MGRDAATTLREIEASDIEAVADLLAEMQAHYGAFCPPGSEIVAGLWKRPEGTRILLALEEDRIAGLASFSAIYPGPGLTSGLFLKDLYVRSDRRRAGLGRALMARLAAIAVSEGHSRLDWTVDGGDRRLQSFYEMLGGKSLPEKRFYRLSGTPLARLSEE